MASMIATNRLDDSQSVATRPNEIEPGGRALLEPLDLLGDERRRVAGEHVQELVERARRPRRPAHLLAHRRREQVGRQCDHQRQERHQGRDPVERDGRRRG